MRIFQTARDLSDAREGALFLVVREPDDAVPQLVAPADRLDLPIRELDARDRAPEGHRAAICFTCSRGGRSLISIPACWALAALDGATVTDRSGRLLAAGAILRHPPSEQLEAGGAVEGARTTAAMAASQFGPVLKVSEDGIITFFDRERVWDI